MEYETRTILYDRLENNGVQCVCQWECRIQDGKTGYAVRSNENGTIYLDLRRAPRSMTTIEKKPRATSHQPGAL